MTIGQQLRQAREERALSIEQVSQETHIRVQYLSAIEADNFSLLPSLAQTRGFIRAYAVCLKLDAAPLLATLDGVKAPLAITPAPIQVPHPENGSSAAEPRAIFSEIGQKLQHQREILGLSIDDVERHTHIRVHYLHALEIGNLEGLPSPVQGRGMLKNYAHFLGLDYDQLLLRFADGLQARLEASRSTGKATPKRQAKQVSPGGSLLRRLFSTDLLISLVLVVFLIGFTAWGTLRISEIRRGQGITPTAQSIAEVLLSTPVTTLTEATPALNSTNSITPTAQDPEGAAALSELLPTATITATLSLPEAGSAPIMVSIVVRQRAWMRATVDGEVVFQGRVAPGSAYSYSGNERIEIQTGNGAALHLYFNQQDLGIMGDFGEVLYLTFTPLGVQTPTATVAPTRLPLPTDTPAPTVTPAIPVTLAPTSTPTLRP